MTTIDSIHHDNDTGAHANAVSPDRMLESAFAFWRSALLLSAHEVGLFAELALGPRDAHALVGNLRLRAEAITNFLEALVALGLVERQADQYRNNPEVDLFLDLAKPDYVGRWFDMAGAAIRDTMDYAAHLRASNMPETGSPPLADRMWKDVAAIVRDARLNDAT